MTTLRKEHYEGFIDLVNDAGCPRCQPQKTRKFGPLESMDKIKSAMKSAIRGNPTLEEELRRNDPDGFPETQEANLSYVIVRTYEKGVEFVEGGYIFHSDREEQALCFRPWPMNPEDVNSRLKRRRTGQV